MDAEQVAHINRLKTNAEEAVSFFSEPRKSERERGCCAAFLRFLGVGFRADEMVLVEPDPPDVVFRQARFEVCEILDPDRRRHDEWKARARSLRGPVNGDAVFVDLRQARTLSYNAVFDLVTNALQQKAVRYGPATCKDLDALVCINLLSTTLDPLSQLPVVPTSRISHGWRSVSFVMPPYSHVIFASTSAPGFLALVEGQTASKPDNPDNWFELVDNVVSEKTRRDISNG